MQPKSIILFFYGYILFFRRQIARELILSSLAFLSLSCTRGKLLDGILSEIIINTVFISIKSPIIILEQNNN